MSAELGENLVPHIFTCLEDRNPDARKSAQSIIVPLMQQIGYQEMAKAANRLKQPSKDLIFSFLDKARESVVVSQPTGAGAQVKKPNQLNKVVKGGSGKSQVSENDQNSTENDGT